MLWNPKFAHNVGNAVRGCSCFGIRQLWWTGDRVPLDTRKGQRLPREERMKGYKDVDQIRSDRVFDAYEGVPVTPVAIEVRPNSEILPDFIHPENPLYVFGPEDGSLPSWVLGHCHRFLFIPSRHCLNLASALNIVLCDRMSKLILSGEEPRLRPEEYLAEHRGLVEDGAEIFTGISAQGMGRGHRAHSRTLDQGVRPR
jgi:tRNA(Leu) C34 or U34 (ribose-2'-O)-methylase TrmL